MGTPDLKRTSWRRAALLALVWLAAAAVLHGLVRRFCFAENLGVQGFVYWGTLVFASVPAVGILTGTVHRSWKVAVLVLVIGAVAAFIGVDQFQ